MADKPKESSGATGWIERRFAGIADYLGSQISRFVAFLFLLFTVGAFFGAFIYTNYPNIGIYLIIAPAIMGLIAYYNRIVAIVLFALFAIFFVI